MRPLSLSLLAFLSLAFAPAASAVSVTEWSFRGETEQTWQDQGLLSATQLEEGLRIVVGPRIGGLARPVSLNRRYDTVEVTMRSEKKVTGYFLWHLAGTPQDEMPQVGFEVAGSGAFTTVAVPLSYYDQWQRSADFIGIGFDKDADVTLASIALKDWGTLESLGQAVRGFWTFDEFKPHSINFLWGPLLSYNPAMRGELYATLPPRAHSATQVMYALLGALLAIAVAFRFVLPSRSLAAWGLLASAFMGLWILFDVRMGSELISYVLRDINGYALAPEGAKKLRTHDLIYDVLNRSMPVLKKEERFGLVTPESAFYSLVRYQAYPTLPITPDREQTGLTEWLVAYRPDARIDEQSRLVVGTKILSGPGKIVTRYNDESFHFSTRP